MADSKEYSDKALTVCKDIMRKHGLRFYTATQLFPSRIRNAVIILYAFYRLFDQVVDVENRDDDKALKILSNMRAYWCSITSKNDYRYDARLLLNENNQIQIVLPLAAEVFKRHNIPLETSHYFITGMEADLNHADSETWQDLNSYMFGSARVVGHMLIYVMGLHPQAPDTDTVFEAADSLSDAFQLINMLRDFIVEDYSVLGRIYFPKSLLDKHGVTTKDLDKETLTANLKNLILEICNEAEKRLEAGIAGIDYLPEDCRAAVMASACVYRDRLAIIRKHPELILKEKVTIPEWKIGYIFFSSLPRRLYSSCASRIKTLSSWVPVSAGSPQPPSSHTVEPT